MWLLSLRCFTDTTAGKRKKHQRLDFARILFRITTQHQLIYPTESAFQDTSRCFKRDDGINLRLAEKKRILEKDIRLPPLVPWSSGSWSVLLIPWSFPLLILVPDPPHPLIPGPLLYKQSLNSLLNQYSISIDPKIIRKKH